MKILKITLCYLILTMTLTGVSYAQIIDCNAIGESPNDTVKFVFSQGLPGDTVNVPLHITNDTGIAGFSIYIEYDSTILKPVITAVDTLYDSLGTMIAVQEFYEYLVTGRFLKTDTTQGPFGQVIDTVTSVLVVSETDFISPDSITNSRLKILALPDFINPETVIIPGSDVIMYLRFVIASNASLGAFARMDFYKETIEILDTVFPFPVIRTDCIYSRYGDASGIIDVRFTPVWATVQVEAAGDLPTIQSFAANPSTINPGSSTTLSWSVANATSLSINQGVGSVTPVTSGSVSVSPSTTITYTLTATNTAGSVQQSTTVFIAGTNNPPVIQSVSGNPFTINQGETVLFSVIATDADASDIITLRATSLPPNANFNTVTGTSSVTGNFSFTPDFTQTGSLAATFEADDGQGGIATMLVVINVIELENDRLFSTSALGQEPVGGLKGKGDVYLPINLITSQTVYGVQFDFFYNPSYFKVDSFVVTGRTADYVVYENIGQIPGEVRIVAFSLANEPIINIVDTTAIMYVVLSIDSLTAEGNYNFAFKNGWESVNPDPNYPSLALVTDSGIIQVDRLGDPNLDQHIDVADLVSIVAHIINNFTFNARQFDAADLIVNDTVNVFDLVGVINLIYGIPVTPAPPQYYDDLPATISLAYNDLPAGSNELMLVHSEIPTDIAAVELEINYDPASVTLGKPTLAEDASGLDIRYSDNDYGKLKVLLHFTNPFNSSQLIREGKANLINIPIIAEDAIISGDKEQLSITKALFATPSAAMVNVEGFNNSNNPLPVTFRLSQNYPNPFNPTTRIDFSIEKQEHVILNIYNILGQQVNSLIDENMPAGSYSIIWDATDDNGNKVATGIYLYKLQVDQKTKSKKMLFLK